MIVGSLLFVLFTTFFSLLLSMFRIAWESERVTELHIPSQTAETISRWAATRYWQKKKMRESLAIILTVYVSLVLCQVLNNRQQDLDEFITQLAQRNQSRPVQPFQNPNQPSSSNQFWNDQSQGAPPSPQLNTGQSSSFNPVSYPTSNGQSSNRPTHNVNVSAFDSATETENEILYWTIFN